MNRLKILLITAALITGSSALASAEEHYQTGFSVRVQLGNEGHGYFRYRGDGDDHYRYADRDNRWRDRDDRWRDNDDRGRRYRDDDDRRGRDWDRDGDRR